MTMLEDEALSALLRQLGDSYAIPPSGVADTLRRVRRSDNRNVNRNEAEPDDHASTAFDEEGGAEELAAGTVRRMIRTHLWLSVAASLIVLLALAGGALLLGTSSNAPKTTTALKALPPTATRHAPSQKSAAPGASFSAAAPSTPSTSGGATATGASSLPTGSVGQPARIAQTGSLDLNVARGALTSTMNKLTALASAYGGFVANSQTQSGGSVTTSGSSTSGSVTLQVPVANFSPLLAAAKSLGQTSALTTKATDVTSQYVDLQSRITALEASRQQYLTIMTKASSVGDVLAVQAQLDNLQSEIEQLQGQLAVLQNETDYSTLTVMVGEVTHHHATKPAESGIVKAWKDSLHGFAVGVDGIIRFAGPALFALLCLAALVLGGRLTWRRLQRHNL